MKQTSARGRGGIPQGPPQSPRVAHNCQTTAPLTLVPPNLLPRLRTQGRAVDGASRRLLRSLSTPTLTATDATTNGKQQEAALPSCRPGSKLLSGRFVPRSEDCSKLAVPVLDVGKSSSTVDSDVNTYETPVWVCSDAFETTAGVLGSIYTDGAQSRVLSLTTRAADGHFLPEQPLKNSPAAAVADAQAFHIQCDVAGDFGVDADDNAGLVGDACRIVHWASGLCVVEVGGSDGLPGQLMVDQCSRELSGGAMWRFCTAPVAVEGL